MEAATMGRWGPRDLPRRLGTCPVAGHGVRRSGAEDAGSMMDALHPQGPTAGWRGTVVFQLGKATLP